MILAALCTWIGAIVLGAYMVSVASGASKTPGGAVASKLPPLLIFLHAGLAGAGLLVWIAYFARDGDPDALAWIALVDLLVVAGLGQLMFHRWLGERRHPGIEVVTAERFGPDGTPGREAQGRVETTRVESTDLAEQRIPVTAVVLHGLFAGLTVLLVLLSALGV